MSNILVTGGMGFIGSRLSKKLIDEGNNIVVIDNMSYGNFDNAIFDDFNILDKVDFYEIDASDDISHIFDIYNFDYVFHFASIAPLPDCQMMKDECLMSNVYSTMNVLEESRIHGVKRFFLSSSNSLYENVKKEMFPVKENVNIETTLFYPTSKLMAEEICKSFNKTYGINISIFRFANVYGEGMDVLRKYPPVTGAFVKKLINDESPIIYGNGLQSRDFIYIDDLVDAISNVMNNSNENFEVINVASGESHSVIEQYELIASILNKSKIKPIFIKEKDFWDRMPDIYNGEIKIKEEVLFNEVNKCTSMDVSYLHDKYNWEVKYSFYDGLRRTINFYLKKLEG